MMYVHRQSLIDLARDLRDFIAAPAPQGTPTPAGYRR